MHLVHWLVRISVTGLFAVASVASAQSSRDIWFTLGTGGGPVALASRSQPANLLISDTTAVLVDAGDGTAEQLAKIGVPLARIKAILLSHLHADHVGGLAAILALRAQMKITHPLAILGPGGTKGFVDGIQKALAVVPVSDGSALSSPGEGVDVMELASGGTIDLGEISVLSIENTHYAIDKDDDSRPRSLSFRIRTPWRTIVYTGDTGPSADVTRLASGVDLLISEVIDTEAELKTLAPVLAGMPPERIEGLRNFFRSHHLEINEVANLAKQANPKFVALTHFGRGTEGVEANLRIVSTIGRSFSGPIVLARDLDAF